MLRTVRSFWRAARGRAAFEHDMDDEMRFHLESRTAELVGRGFPPAKRRAGRGWNSATPPSTAIAAAIRGG